MPFISTELVASTCGFMEYGDAGKSHTNTHNILLLHKHPQ